MDICKQNQTISVSIDIKEASYYNMIRHHLKADTNGVGTRQKKKKKKKKKEKEKEKNVPDIISKLNVPEQTPRRRRLGHQLIKRSLIQQYDQTSSQN